MWADGVRRAARRLTATEGDFTRRELDIRFQSRLWPRPFRSCRRAAILASKLRELDGFCLVVDCGTPECRGERSYLVASLAAMLGPIGRWARSWRGCDARRAVTPPWRRLGWQPGQCSMLASAHGA